jgi:O-antigen/teichoic acid export membrane protein
MGLKSDIIKSLRWQVGAIILQKIITVVATIILAGRLGPSAFGLPALALVVINAVDLFKSLGIDTALVRIEGDFQKAA